jgi:Tfp pilus assembly protein PilO
MEGEEEEEEEEEQEEITFLCILLLCLIPCIQYFVYYSGNMLLISRGTQKKASLKSKII